MRFIRTATPATGGGSTRLPLIRIARRAIRVRSYRRHTAIVRAPRNAPTATPLVRRRLVLEPNTANGSWRWYARIKRGRRPKAIVSRAPSVPTATPLVRKRLVQTPVANDRANFIHRVFRRKRAHAVSRNTPGLVAGSHPFTLVRMRRSWRLRYFTRHQLRRARGVSTTTPTPLTRRRLVQTPNSNDRAHFRARWFNRKRAHLISRPPVALPLPPVRVQPALIRRSRSIRAYFARHAPQLLRPPAASQRATRAIVVRSVRALLRSRTQRRKATVVRALRAPAATRVGRTVYVTSNRRRAANRAYTVRHRAHFETSTLGSAAAAPVIVVGAFDASMPAGGSDAAQAREAAFDAGQPGVTA